MWKKFEKFLDNNTLFVYIAKCVSIASAIMTVLFAVFVCTFCMVVTCCSVLRNFVWRGDWISLLARRGILRKNGKNCGYVSLRKNGVRKKC